MQKANDEQVGGDHYKSQSIQPWDFIAANELDFFEGNIIKYVARHKDKNGVEDLKKARHYLDKLIELSSPPERTVEERIDTIIRALESLGKPRNTLTLGGSVYEQLQKELNAEGPTTYYRGLKVFIHDSDPYHLHIGVIEPSQPS